MNKRIKYYLIFFFISVNIFLFFFYISYIFLKKNNEHLDINSIVKKQIFNSNSLYSSSINIDYQNYIKKKNLLIKPEIIILGSSRMQYFPGFLFKKKLLIAQQPFYSFDMFYESINDLIKIHKPKLIIVGIDWWLFNKNFNERSSKILFNNLFQIPKQEEKIYNKSFLDFSLNELIKPYLWVIEKKISFDDFFLTVNNKNYFQNIGVTANLQNSGYDLNGYYVDNFRVSGKKNYDIGFHDTIKEFKNNQKNFIAFSFDENSLEIFKKINDISNNNNIKIIFYMPPVSPKIFNVLKEDGYIKNFDFISEKLTVYNNFYDFTYKSYYKDCQFIDGYHAGEVLNFINLKMIFNTQNELSDFLSNTINEDIITQNINRATFKNINTKIKIENDFLKIGCFK
jgi:ribosomal protein S8